MAGYKGEQLPENITAPCFSTPLKSTQIQAVSWTLGEVIQHFKMPCWVDVSVEEEALGNAAPP